MPVAGIGARLKRKEDPRLITGSGTYTDDIKLPNMVHMAVVRSPHAHARIRRIDTAAARSAPGVVAVLTGEELKAGLMAPLPCAWLYEGLKNPPHWPLAIDRVRHVGEGVAVVVAETRAAAKDAAALVEVDYEPLPAVVDPEKAMESGAPLVHDQFDTNVAYTWEAAGGDVEAAFREADVVIRQRHLQQRLVPMALEPRAVVADCHPATGELTVWSTTQIPHLLKVNLCGILGVPEHQMRVIAPEVGGGFGAKLNVYPEEVIVPYLARKLRRPVKWVEDRRENFVTTIHGREGIIDVEVAARRDGEILGMRINWICDLGAYNQLNTPYIPILGLIVSPGPYRHKHHAIKITGVFTNKTPTDAYRGAGRPEATHFLERTIDRLADELGLDPAEVRRKNFVRKDEFPYTNPVGITYDSGDYHTALDKALEAVGYEDLKREQAERRQRGDRLQLGIGISSYIEACGLAPSAALAGTFYGGNLFESAQVRVHHTGKVTVYTGSSAHGQGHETAWSQIVASELGIPPEDVEVLHGDTGRGPIGLGTYGSRSAAVGGIALYQALQKVKRKAALIAAHQLECSPEDLEFVDGQFRVKGAPQRAIKFTQIAAAANLGSHINFPPGLEPGLEETAFWQPENFTFPFGTHVCVVEVDTEDGRTRILRYVCVDDCGNVINPLLAEGQIHGGIAQGIAQALYEELVYDENGQPLNASLMEYAVPTAAELPSFESHFTCTPSPVNPLGVKGIGEAGTIAATPAVVNAIVDAVSHLGVRHIDMPCKPERVWRAIQEAQQAAAAAEGGEGR
ncbi:xanthine dehydrogenase family protein molybdopterin-binding subunit [Thermaerobacter litoralis]